LWVGAYSPEVCSTSWVTSLSLNHYLVREKQILVPIVFTERKSKSNTQVHRRTRQKSPRFSQAAQKMPLVQYLICDLSVYTRNKAFSKTVCWGCLIISLVSGISAPAKG